MQFNNIKVQALNDDTAKALVLALTADGARASWSWSDNDFKKLKYLYLYNGQLSYGINANVFAEHRLKEVTATEILVKTSSSIPDKILTKGLQIPVALLDTWGAKGNLWNENDGFQTSYASFTNTLLEPMRTVSSIAIAVFGVRNVTDHETWFRVEGFEDFYREYYLKMGVREVCSNGLDLSDITPFKNPYTPDECSTINTEPYHAKVINVPRTSAAVQGGQEFTGTIIQGRTSPVAIGVGHLSNQAQGV